MLLREIRMHLPLKYSLVGSLAITSVLAVSSIGIAQETSTTTTTRTTTERPAPGIVVGVPGVAGVQIGGGERRDDCVTRKTTRTDEETGDSATRTRTRCN